VALAKLLVKHGQFLADVAIRHVVERFADCDHVIRKLLFGTMRKTPLVERFLRRNLDLARRELLAEEMMKIAQINAHIDAHGLLLQRFTPLILRQAASIVTTRRPSGRTARAV
jgi:hypothetical protein